VAEPNAEYVRQLEDACLMLWYQADHLALRSEYPGLADFLGHLHHSIDHVETMVRRNVWAAQIDRYGVES
jgi:hypothetical protein